MHWSFPDSLETYDQEAGRAAARRQACDRPSQHTPRAADEREARDRNKRKADGDDRKTRAGKERREQAASRPRKQHASDRRDPSDRRAPAQRPSAPSTCAKSKAHLARQSGVPHL